MTTDDRLREQQRQNELKAFNAYQRRLHDAYRRATRKDPRTALWCPTDHSR